MFTVRRAITASIVVCVASVLLGIYSLSKPPDSGGAATDSYGTRWSGYRATYELLGELGTPVDRRFAPPSPELPTPTTFVLWLPSEELIANEPSYLKRMLEWVEQGGRIVVAPARPDHGFKLSMKKEAPVDVLGALGLSHVSVTGRSVFDIADPAERLGRTARRERLRRSAEGNFDDGSESDPINFYSYTPTATGTLQPALARVKKLNWPRESTAEVVISGSKDLATGKLLDGDRVLAAAFARGKGEIVVVGETSLIMNVRLTAADNAVFVYDLLTAGGTRGVVFDEFYHGLSVRGNPLWLLTHSRYWVAALVGLTTMGLFLLRRGMVLGPPLEALPKSRRSLNEYVEAMSHLFHHGRGKIPFLLTEVRAGALRTLADRYNLAAGEHVSDSIAVAIGRRSPADADRFREAYRRLEEARKRGRTCPPIEALKAIQGISRCL